uniref:protein-serine/threonine phosphatase n=1 Tax=Linum usitatissimum TaxID=4006 RepID=A0A165G119_LINUS|nr:protein phosphatase 2c [Linum usitatissimum]
MLLSWLARIAMACWRPVVRRYARMSKDDSPSTAGGLNSSSNDDLELGGGERDSLLWSRDLEKYSCGEFSFAVVQANDVIEDHSQVESGRDSVFVGVYDGHGGPEASRFISDHLFKHFTRFGRDSGTISAETLRHAFSATEDGFLTVVRRSYEIKPLMAAIGSCCLAGVIYRGTLYVANLGDSRAVIGCLSRRSKKIVAEQLTNDHNASMEEVRAELKSLHPDDSHIVVMKHGAWRIKGIIQVSRSIGDAYLKRPEFSLNPSFPRFHLSEPIRRPVLTSEPSIVSRDLQPEDKFLIFASDGLWEHITNQEAVEIVHNNQRTGIARRLVEAALNRASVKRAMTYQELKNVERGQRRTYHDDITVVVVFIDHENSSVPEISVRGFVDTVGPSNFNIAP